MSVSFVSERLNLTSKTVYKSQILLGMVLRGGLKGPSLSF